MGRFYFGHTNDLERRIDQHNNVEYKLCRTTKVLKRPWKIVWSKECSELGQATKVEKNIKKRGISRFLEAQLGESRRRWD